MSKTDIKSKINRLNNQINNLNEEQKNYKNAKESSNKLVNNLKSVKDYLSKTENALKTCYTKNGKIAKETELSSCKEDIDNLLNMLNNTVLPNISQRISNLSRNIDRKKEEVKKLWEEYDACED